MRVAEFVGRLHLRQLHLVAESRERGIGTVLIKALLERATLLGKGVTLDVPHGNRASLLYRRLGFRRAGQGRRENTDDLASKAAPVAWRRRNSDLTWSSTIAIIPYSFSARCVDRDRRRSCR